MFLGFVFSSTAHPWFCPWRLLHWFQRDSKESGQKSWRGLIQTYVELPLSHYPSAVWGHQCRLSDQSREERTRPASATPRGGKERSSCFMFIFSGWHVLFFIFLFFPPTHWKANRLIWSIPTGRRRPSCLNVAAERCGTASCPFRPTPDCHAGSNCTFLCYPFFIQDKSAFQQVLVFGHHLAVEMDAS